MGAPCINDTCSITSIIDPVTRRLEISAKLAGNGSIACNEGVIAGLNDGLFVNIPNDTPQALTADQQAHNILVRHTDGTLFASLPHGSFERVVGDYVGIPHTYATPPSGDPSASSLSFNITNPFAHDALLIIAGNFVLNYEVTNTGMGNPGNGVNTGRLVTNAVGGPATDLFPFNMNVAAQLRFGSNSKVTARIDSSGLSPNDGQFKNANEYFAVMYQMAAGEVLAVSDLALHDGLDQRMNINTAPVAGGGNQVGFRTVLQHAIVPIGQDVIGDANTGGL